MSCAMLVVLDTTKVQIFKQITTPFAYQSRLCCCFRYHKGTDFQANHNSRSDIRQFLKLFQIPQRYRFSSKSQHCLNVLCDVYVVLDTTKVQIFKQITTDSSLPNTVVKLFQIPQRYRFSSKSQRILKLLSQV